MGLCGVDYFSAAVMQWIKSHLVVLQWCQTHGVQGCGFLINLSHTKDQRNWTTCFISVKIPDGRAVNASFICSLSCVIEPVCQSIKDRWSDRGSFKFRSNLGAIHVSLTTLLFLCMVKGTLTGLTFVKDLTENQRDWTLEALLNQGYGTTNFFVF